MLKRELILLISNIIKGQSIMLETPVPLQFEKYETINEYQDNDSWFTDEMLRRLQEDNYIINIECVAGDVDDMRVVDEENYHRGSCLWSVNNLTVEGLEKLYNVLAIRYMLKEFS